MKPLRHWRRRRLHPSFTFFSILKISQLSNLYNKSIPSANNYDIFVIPLYRYTRIFPTFFVILHSKLWNFSIPPKSLARNKIRLNFVLDSTRIPPFLLPEIGHIPLSKRRKERKKRYRFSSTRHVLHPTPFFSEKIMGKKDEYRSYLPWPILLSPRSSSLSKRNGRPRNTYSVPAPTAKGPRKWPGNRRTTMSSLRRIGRPSPRWRRPAGSQVAAINPPMLLQVCESHAARRNVTRPAQNSFAGNA